MSNEVRTAAGKRRTQSYTWPLPSATMTSGATVIKTEDYLRDALMSFDQIFLEFKLALERLRFPELESIHAFLGETENNIWVIGNFVGEEAHAAIHQVEGHFLRRFQQFDADVQLIDRQGREAKDIITTDVTTGAMDISYRLIYV